MKYRQTRTTRQTDVEQMKHQNDKLRSCCLFSDPYCFLKLIYQMAKITLRFTHCYCSHYVLESIVFYWERVKTVKHKHAICYKYAIFFFFDHSQRCTEQTECIVSVAI